MLNLRGIVKRNRAFCLLLMLSAVLMLLQSCVPSKLAYEGKLLAPERLVKKLEANRKKIRTFRGTGTIEIKSQKINASASIEILMKNQDSIKISIFGPFGIDVAQALVTREDFLFYDVINNSVYRGKVNDDVLKRIFKVDLRFDEIRDLFTGAVNLSEKLSVQPESYEVTEGQYVLTYLNAARGTKEVFRVGVDDLSLMNYSLIKNETEVLLEGKYSNIRILQTLPVAYSSIFTDKSKNQTVKIDYGTVELNRYIGSMLVDYPQDAKIVK